ncbi:MAG: DUF4364 family protein [Lachnospiraceae bacterium]|nr:DUF4364 family protein [Lachnospiraceae bacterium]
MSESLTVYKLIVLYMLKKVEFPLSNAQISELILGNEYTTYFKLQTALSELSDAGLVAVETAGNSSYYSLTESGAETLQYFKNRIPEKFRREINQYLKENHMKLRDEASVQADYYKNTAGEYSVHCRVKEKYCDLIDLTISVPEESQAKSICLEWRKKSQPIYEYIMKQLLP